MEAYVIKKNSKLYKLVEFLSKIPFYNAYIKYSSYNDNRYTTFNDICTFCRHVLYTIFVSFFYLLLFVFFANVLIIQPILSIFSGGSLAGNLTLTYILFIFVIYIITIIMQKLCSLDFDFINTDVIFDNKPVGVIKEVAKVVSQKHDNFCKRLKTED